MKTSEIYDSISELMKLIFTHKGSPEIPKIVGKLKNELEQNEEAWPFIERRLLKIYDENKGKPPTKEWTDIRTESEDVRQAFRDLHNFQWKFNPLNYDK